MIHTVQQHGLYTTYCNARGIGMEARLTKSKAVLRGRHPMQCTSDAMLGSENTWSDGCIFWSHNSFGVWQPPVLVCIPLCVTCMVAPGLQKSKHTTSTLDDLDQF